jgi:tRNA pseudouridine synthase 10
MFILEKVLEIYQKYYICIDCLGRMFSLLGTDTTNYERGRSLLLVLTMENHHHLLSSKVEQDVCIENLKLIAERACFGPAIEILKKEGLESVSNPSIQRCYLCNDLFSQMEIFAQNAINHVKDIEFDTFLVGSTVDAQLINKEDEFKAEFNLLEAESIKSHFNREVGKIISQKLKKPAEFLSPDITIIFNLNPTSHSIDLLIRALFVYGRYNKYMRNIPQTHWNCGKCKGKGCELCKYTGKQYSTSVEELITPIFISESMAKDSKFHGGGREDIDVRMLGDGRPFILELRNPKIRTLNLRRIEKKVNKQNRKKVKVSNLKCSSKAEVKTLKKNAEQTRKTYLAKVTSKTKINKDEFNNKMIQLRDIFINNIIKQRTPHRVSHRRADKIREKKIYKVEGKYRKSTLFEFTIETQGGVYIKELITGDDGRTKPSFSEIFNSPLLCEELDVLKIYS